MKNRGWIISIIIMIILCSLLFFNFYHYERARVIGETTQNQKNVAHLAVNAFQELIIKWNSELFYLTRQPNIIKMNRDGKADLEKQRALLKDEISSITRTDKKGRIIFTTPYFPNANGTDISQQKHMSQILSYHMPVVSEVFKTVQGFQAIAIHYPIYKNGEYEGSLAFVINFKNVTKRILSDIKIGLTGFSWMLSSDGAILSVPDTNLIGHSIFELSKNTQDLSELTSLTMSEKEGSFSGLIDKLSYTADNERYLTYFIPIKCNNTFWTVAVSCSEEEVVSAIYGYTQKLAIILLVLLFAGIIISYWGLKAWVIVKEAGARKKVEEELIESEKRYRVISSMASDYMFSANIGEDGNVYLDSASENFEKMAGVTIDEYNALGGWRAALYPDDYVRDDENMKMLRANQHVTTELRTRRKNGKTGWIKIYAHPIWDESKKKLIGMYGGVRDIDKIKRAQEELLKSEDKFSKAFHSSPDSIAIAKLYTGELIDVNLGFERIFGFTKEEAIGKNAVELKIFREPRDREVLINKVMTGEIFVSAERELYTKSGEVRICNLYYSPMEFAGEKCVVATVRDLTEFKKAERALKESEEKFRIAFDNAPSGMSLINSEGQYLDVNPMQCNMIGYTKEEVLSGTFYKITHPEDEEKSRLWLNKMISGDLSEPELEKRYIHKDGHIVWGLVRAQWIKDNNGNPVISIAHVLDITERKLAEIVLKENEAKFHIAFDNAPSGMIMYDHDGIYREVNQMFCDMLGYRRDELIEKHSSEFIHPDDFEMTKSWSLRINNGDFSQPELEKRYFHKDGHIVWALTRTQWIHYNDNRTSMAISHIVDITDRKNTELALRETEYFLNRSQEIGKIGAYKFDLVNNKWSTSPSLDLIFGIDVNSRKTLEGWLSIIHEEDREICRNLMIEEVLKKHNRFDREYRINKVTDGKEIWVHGLGELEYDNNGVPLRVIGTIQDITDRKLTELAIRETEYYLNRSQEVGKIGSFKYDYTNNKFTTSASLDKIFGLDETAERTLEGWFRIIHPEDRAMLKKLFEDVLLNNSRLDSEYRLFRFNDKKEIWVRGLGEMEFDEKGNPVRLIGTVQDITDKKYNSAILQRTNRQLRMLIDCNQALIRSNNENELLSAICKIIVKTGEYSKAWVGYSEKDSDKSIKKMAHYGYKNDYLNKIKVSWSDSELGRGPVGTAIRTGMPCIIKDIKNDFRFLPWRNDAAENGIESASAFPIKIGTQTIGSLNIYSSKSDYFDEHEIRLLTELADDLSFGIAAIRTRAERERIEESLRHSENFLNTVLEHSPHPMWISDENGTLIQMNEACRKLFRVKNKDVVGIYNLFNDEAIIEQGMLYQVEKVFKKGETVSFKIYYDTSKLKNISLAETVSIIVILTVTPVLDYHGNVTNAIIQHVDITEREKVENELRKLSRQNEEAMKMAHMAYWEYDVATNRYTFNDNYYKMQGLPTLQKEGYVIDAKYFNSKYFVPEYYNLAQESLTEALDTNDPNFEKQTELIVFDDNGERHNMDTWFRIEKDNNGNTVRMYGVSQDITERKKVESMLSASIRDKEVLLKEIYHRTKNNMWVISSILELQSESLENKEARNILKDTVNRIYAMALVHQKLYQSKNLSKIDLKNYIRDLIKLLVNAYEVSSEKVELKLKLSSVYVLIDSAIPLGLVINELITNSFKYAFPGDRKGEIDINLFKSDQGEIKIDINDNGVGFSNEKASTKFKSIGLKLISEIVERQLNGKIKYDNANGVHCSITFYDTLYTERV
jgi:PAS domain S-box-containing protein